MAEDVKVVVPELILDEEGHDRPDRPQETAGIADGVERQVADDVGTLVVLTHLIARRREEGEQNLVLRMVATELLHERTALLELAQGGRMEPYILCRGIYFLLQQFNSLALATPHLAHLRAEKAANGDTD